MCDSSLSLVKGLNSFVRSGRLIKCVINKIVCLWLYSMLSTFPAKRRKGLLSLSRLRIITLSVCVCGRSSASSYSSIICTKLTGNMPRRDGSPSISPSIQLSSSVRSFSTSNTSPSLNSSSSSLSALQSYRARHRRGTPCKKETFLNSLPTR